MDKLLEVRFSRTTENEIKGKIFHDPRPVEEEITLSLGENDVGEDMTEAMASVDGFKQKVPRLAKIVLINGFNKDRVNNWETPLPQDGEWWLCQEIRDTRVGDANKGAIIVRLWQNLTAEKLAEINKEKRFLNPIIDYIQEAEKFGGSAKTDSEIYEMACELRSYTEYMVDHLGVDVAIGTLRQARKSSSLVGMHSEISKVNVNLLDHYVWTSLQQFDIVETVRRLCLEAMIVWLGKIKKGEVQVRKNFFMTRVQYFKCPRCPTNVKVSDNAWQNFQAQKTVLLKCPICSTEGRALPMLKT